MSAAARGGAAGIAFEAGAVAQQGEIAAFLARLAFIAFGLGLGPLAGLSRARLRALVAADNGKLLLLDPLRGLELLLQVGSQRRRSVGFCARLAAAERGDVAARASGRRRDTRSRAALPST